MEKLLVLKKRKFHQIKGNLGDVKMSSDIDIEVKNFQRDMLSKHGIHLDVKQLKQYAMCDGCSQFEKVEVPLYTKYGEPDGISLEPNCKIQPKCIWPRK